MRPVAIDALGALLLAVILLVLPSAAGAQSREEAIAAAVAAGDKRHALLVGVGNYERTVPVRFVEENLDAVESMLRDVFFVPEANIRRVTDPSFIDLSATFGFDPGEPGDFGGLSIAEPDAELFVYFIGHGSRDLRAAGTSDAAASEGFLLARNSRPANLSRTAYSYDTLIANLDAFRARHFPEGRVVLFLESCFSGETNDGPINPTLGPMIAPIVGWEPPAESHDVVAIAAAGADTPAYWDDERRLGLFTDALVRGLRGGADDGDGTLTLEELGRYLSDSVPARALSLGKSEQRPQLTIRDDAPLVSLVRSPTIVGDSSSLLIGFEVDDLEIRFADTDPKDFAAMAVLRDDVARFMDECGDACRPLLARLLVLGDQLETNVRRCEAAAVMTGRHLSRGSFDRIAAFDAICAPPETVAACVASRDATSPACSCLEDPRAAACRADPLARCAPLLAAAADSARAVPSLAALDEFAAAEPACAEANAAALAQAREAVCAAGARAHAGGDVPEGLAACPFAATARAEASARQDCAAALRSVEAAPRDHALLAAFLAREPACEEADRAEAMRDERLSAALRAAARAETPVARKRAREDLGDLLAAFRDGLSSAAVARVEDALASLDRPACAIAFRNAEIRGVDALRRFVAERADCTAETRAAESRIAEARCGSAFERVDRSDAASLFDFIDANPSCTSQVRQARSQAELIATQCIHRAGGLEARDAGAAIRAYRECDATFGLAFDWVGEEASRSIERLRRVAFCADALELAGRDGAALRRFIATASAQCPDEAFRARGILADLVPPSPDGIYDGARGYTDSGRPSPDASCLPRYEFVATVRNGTIVFDSDGRRWTGRVGGDGAVNLGRSDISPSPRTETWIAATIRNGRGEGTLYNGYCGNGFFTLTRR